ncbi:MAG: hypothetical protein AAGF84_14890 [Planctomycetota bacterium]
MRRVDLRINVIGTSGAGKTTLAARLGERLGVPHVELDALHWGPDWTSRPDADFHGDLRAFVAADSWVLCGNYTNTRPVFTHRVNCFVWLDYPRWLVTWRVLRRSIGRAWTKRELWAGNRESFRLTFLSRDSIIWWSFKTFGKNRRKYQAMFEELAGRADVQAVRLRSPRDAERWLDEMVRSETAA